MLAARVLALGLGIAVAAMSAPGFARTPTAASKTAHKRDLTKKAKKRKTKKRASKHRRVAAAKQPRPRVKTTAKPLVKVAVLQSDGRVRYGPDRMPPGFAWPPTAQMRETESACERELDAMGISWKRGSAEEKIADPVVVPAMELGGIKYTSIYQRAPHALDCQFARNLALLGPDLYALGVREVQFGSIYRNTMARSHGKTQEFLSRHALGIAMDIRSFVDDKGRVAVVEMEYLKGDALLHGIEDLINKNTRWRQVLTPANDPISHDDHFHIEASVDFTTFR